MMNSLDRTRSFIAGIPVDRPPFHPIIMRFAAQYAGFGYRDFCLDPHTKCEAMIRCADELGLDWVTTMSDPYTEGDAFGLQIEYPENDLPKSLLPLLPDLDDLSMLRVPEMSQSFRQMNRIREVEEFSKRVGDRLFIVGWIEGPMAMLAVLRGLTNACIDLLTEQERVEKLLDIVMQNSINFI